MSKNDYSTMFIDGNAFRDDIKNEINVVFPFLVKFIQCNILYIDSMIKEYTHFMGNILNSKQCGNIIDTKGLSNSIQLIWKIHLLHPKMYVKDVKRITNGHDVIFPDKLRFDINNFDANNDINGSDINDGKYGEFISFDIKKSLLKQKDFMNKIMNTDIDINKSINDYKHFIQLIGQTNKIMVPTLHIDLVWHTHMIHHDKYIYETKLLSNGKCIGHNDLIDDHRLKESIEITKQEWIKYNNSQNKNNNNNILIFLFTILFSVLLFIDNIITIIIIGLPAAFMISLYIKYNNYCINIDNTNLGECGGNDGCQSCSICRAE